jgi:single-stranded-DNA-specific exonuclease
MQPVFQADDLELAGKPRRLGRDGTHLKFWVRQRNQSRQAMEVIGFGMHEHFDTLQQSQVQGIPLELLFSIEENTWQGVTNIQLKARDLRLQKMTTN